jgi:3-oxoacyl-[acyl-carrier protein] reductase
MSRGSIFKLNHYLQVLTLAMAKDVGEYKINVNCVAPGVVYTPMVRGALKDHAATADSPEDERYDAACKLYCILGHGQTAEDISNGVLFLCSEQARNVNGHVLFVDGGFLGI